MNNKDEKLLTLAAKALGLEDFTIVNNHPTYRAFQSGLQDWVAWDPLNNEIDAYRLAKALRMRINFDMQYVCVTDTKGVVFVVSWPEDEVNETRAFVRAAAYLGEQK